MSKALLRPGTMVVVRFDQEYLVIWKSRCSDFNEDCAVVKSDDILLVLNARRTTRKEREKNDSSLTDEWTTGSYQVLTPLGIIGWVGAGWVTTVNDRERSILAI